MCRALKSRPARAGVAALAALPASGCVPAVAGLREPAPAVAGAVRVGVDLGATETFVTRYVYRVDGGITADVRLGPQGPPRFVGGVADAATRRADSLRAVAFALVDGQDTSCGAAGAPGPPSAGPPDWPWDERPSAGDEPWVHRVGPYACHVDGAWAARWRYVLRAGRQLALLRVDAPPSRVDDARTVARIDAVARALLRSMQQ